MEHLDFVLWLMLFPLADTLNSYFQKKIKGDEYETPGANINLIITIIYFIIAYLIY